MVMKNAFENILAELINGNLEKLYSEMNELTGNELDKQKTQLWEDAKEYILANIKPKEIKTIDDLAKLLNNNYYLSELKNSYNIDIEKICVENKWVILFPYSDDNIEIRGYVYDEIGAWEGGDFKLVKQGDFYQDDEDNDVYRKSKTNKLVGCPKSDAHIFIRWEPKDHQEYIWYIDTDYTNVAYFNIIDDDDCDDKIWARCCIIDCSKILN